MVDLVITAANVAVPSTGARTMTGVAGVTITAGQTVYQDPTDSKLKLADCNSATVAQRVPLGVSLHGSLAGQPLTIQQEGPCTVGATLTPGVAYYQSATPGMICPVADLVAGCYPTVLGIATSTTVLDLKIHASGASL